MKVIEKSGEVIFYTPENRVRQFRVDKGRVDGTMYDAFKAMGRGEKIPGWRFTDPHRWRGRSHLPGVPGQFLRFWTAQDREIVLQATRPGRVDPGLLVVLKEAMPGDPPTKVKRRKRSAQEFAQPGPIS